MAGIRPKLYNKWKVLRPDEIERIHQETMTILSETGVVFQSVSIRELFLSRGAKVEGEKVFIPRHLVTEAIESAPDKFILHGRHPSRDLQFGIGKVYYTNCFGPVRVRDPGMKETRPGTLKDLENFTLLSDCLDNIALCLFHVRPSEIPPSLHDLYCAATMLRITDKHIHFSQDNSTNTETLIAMGRIAAADAGISEPVFSLGGCSTSPLVYSEDVCERFRLAIPQKIPFFVVSGAISGATSPISLAGTLLIQNAEVLAGLTMGQLLSAGAPMAYGCFSGGMDMRTGRFAMGGAELALMQAATVQICEFYGIPFGYGSGGWTDANNSGIQAGFEKAATLLATALSGVEGIHSAAGGMLGGAEIADYVQMMIDDEICDMVNRYLKGIEVCDDTLAVELIGKVGPGGNFLNNDHTASLFRQEHFLPRLLNRDGVRNDSKIYERARERVETLLATHKPKKLSREATEEINALVRNTVERRGFKLDLL